MEILPNQSQLEDTTKHYKMVSHLKSLSKTLAQQFITGISLYLSVFFLTNLRLFGKKLNKFKRKNNKWRKSPRILKKRRNKSRGYSNRSKTIKNSYKKKENRWLELLVKNGQMNSWNKSKIVVPDKSKILVTVFLKSITSKFMMIE